MDAENNLKVTTAQALVTLTLRVNEQHLAISCLTGAVAALLNPRNPEHANKTLLEAQQAVIADAEGFVELRRILKILEAARETL